tara:strand:+ start:1205 stop:1393 length:189 start_codon:yes stop_codon:yes gene_type:complete
MGDFVDTALALLEAGEDTMGVCTKCGDEAYGVEPDAEGYKCESCGERAVMGAAQVVLCHGGF